MGFPIEDKLVIGVASSALFDLAESHNVYETQGVEQSSGHCLSMNGRYPAVPGFIRFWRASCR